MKRLDLVTTKISKVVLSSTATADSLRVKILQKARLLFYGVSSGKILREWTREKKMLNYSRDKKKPRTVYVRSGEGRGGLCDSGL